MDLAFFMGFKNPVLQLKLSDQFFNYPIFYTPLPGGKGLKNLKQNFA